MKSTRLINGIILMILAVSLITACGKKESPQASSKELKCYSSSNNYAIYFIGSYFKKYSSCADIRSDWQTPDLTDVTTISSVNLIGNGGCQEQKGSQFEIIEYYYPGNLDGFTETNYLSYCSKSGVWNTTIK